MNKHIDKNKSKLWKWIVFWCVLILLFLNGITEIKRNIPDTLYIEDRIGSAYELIHQEPWITSSKVIAVSTGDSYTITCKLWNIFPLKTVTVSKADVVEVAASGKHAGIYLETEGILVIDTESITALTGESVAPSEHVLYPGDYIKTINERELTSKEDLVSYMKSASGENVTLGIVREGQEEFIEVTPVLASDNSYKLGIWIKDDAQGIGTITYVTKEGGFGALGHGISDGDTGAIISSSTGDLYCSEILSIKKGDYGTPGELQGVIKYGVPEHLGKISENTDCGIFGYIDENRVDDMQIAWYPVAFKQEITQGPAFIISTVMNETKEYEIEIEDIFWSPQTVNKCFAIRVTDQDLLAETGGIVQGLSGSPIIQNGKLVGAVTHVLVNDPTRGYGIFIENMIKH